MALPINIKDLINGNTVECERIEFKEGYNPESIIHSICAFANDLNNWGGGYIIIGFKEDSGKPIFPAIGLQKNQLDAYQKKIIELCHLIDPFYFPQIQPYDYDEKMILVIWVPGGDNRPYKAPRTLGDRSQKYYFIRRASTSAIANLVEEKRLLELAARIPFDDRISHFGSLKDIDPTLILGHLKEVKSDLYKELPSLTLEELCRNKEIARGPKENLRPLNIALLMFSAFPHKFFRGAIIDIVLYDDNSGTKFIEKQFTGPINTQLKEALSFIKSNVIQEQVIKIANQEEVSRIVNYPFNAIEEVLVNSVYHRSYENDSHTEVNIFKDRIEIISYPGPLAPVDQEAFLQERVIARDYRNRRIGDYLKELKLSEGRGTGIPTIRSTMRETGCPPPEFIVGKDNLYLLSILKINQRWDISTNSKSLDVVQLTNNEQIILENCKYLPHTRKEIFGHFKKKVTNAEINSSIDILINKKYLSDKLISNFWGFYKIHLFATTPAGLQALKHVF